MMPIFINKCFCEHYHSAQSKTEVIDRTQTDRLTGLTVGSVNSTSSCFSLFILVMMLPLGVAAARVAFLAVSLNHIFLPEPGIHKNV